MMNETWAPHCAADSARSMRVNSTATGWTDQPKRIVRAKLLARLASAAILCPHGAGLASAQQLLHSQQRDPYGSPIRISLDYNGQEVFGASEWPSLSSNGRFIGFMTLAPLAPNDANGEIDNYLYDSLLGGPPELISVNLSGGTSVWQAKGDVDPSSDGRFVAFCSDADDLAVGDANFGPDAFVRDRLTGVTELCSISSTGVQGHALVRVAMSDDGRFVVFSSGSTVLVPPDTNGVSDVFVRDRTLGTTEMVSLSSSGVQGNNWSGSAWRVDISGDGRFVCFGSAATNLVPIPQTGKEQLFVRDRFLGQTILISVDSAGQLGNNHSFEARISSDGRIVAFCSLASNLVAADSNADYDVFVRNPLAGSTERVSVDSNGNEANDRSLYPSISPDGRFVAFTSRATNLVTGDSNGTWDVFLHDRLTRRTTRLSSGISGVQSNGESGTPSLGRDGRAVAFFSAATNLVPGDGNSSHDVFVRRAPVPATYCTAKVNSLGCTPAIASAGVPMASFPQGFVVSASNVLNQKVGTLLYSTQSSAALPFYGGTLCLQPPFRRTPQQPSGGSISGADCSGELHFEFNAWIASGADPALSAGRRVWCQYWSRDPGFPPPGNASLTDALTFDIDP